jgi:hypothetical protein
MEVQEDCARKGNSLLFCSLYSKIAQRWFERGINAHLFCTRAILTEAAYHDVAKCKQEGNIASYLRLLRCALSCVDCLGYNNQGHNESLDDQEAESLQASSLEFWVNRLRRYMILSSTEACM